MASKEREPYSSEDLKAIYEQGKQRRVLPNAILINNFYWLRTKNENGESFTFKERLVHILRKAEGNKYHFFEGIENVFSPDEPPEEISGLLDMDGFVVKPVTQDQNDGQLHVVDYELGYFIGSSTSDIVVKDLAYAGVGAAV